MQLGHVHAELVALFKNTFASLGDEVIESVGELGHALTELVKPEVDAGESIGHGGSRGRCEGCA